jgi:hypothetical protein
VSLAGLVMGLGELPNFLTSFNDVFSTVEDGARRFLAPLKMRLGQQAGLS